MATTLDSLSDVAVSSPAACETLVYDECAKQFVNAGPCATCVYREKCEVFGLFTAGQYVPLTPVATTGCCDGFRFPETSADWTIKATPNAQAPTASLFAWNTKVDTPNCDDTAYFLPEYNVCDTTGGKALLFAHGRQGDVRPSCYGGVIELCFPCPVLLESVDLVNIDRFFPPTKIKTFPKCDCDSGAVEHCVALTGNIRKIDDVAQGVPQTVPICREGVSRVRITLDGAGGLLGFRYRRPEVWDRECGVPPCDPLVVDGTMCPASRLTISAQSVPKFRTLQSALEHVLGYDRRCLEPTTGEVNDPSESDDDDHHCVHPCLVPSCPPISNRMLRLVVNVKSLSCEERGAQSQIVLYNQHNLEVVSNGSWDKSARVGRVHLVSCRNVVLDGEWFDAVTVEQSSGVVVMNANIVETNRSRNGSTFRPCRVQCVDGSRVLLDSSILSNSAAAENSSLLFSARGSVLSITATELIGRVQGQRVPLGVANDRGAIEVVVNTNDITTKVWNTDSGVDPVLPVPALRASRCSELRIVGSGFSPILEPVNIGHPDIVEVTMCSVLCCVQNSIAPPPPPPCPDSTSVYNKLIVFFDAGAVGAGETFYIDDIAFVAPQCFDTITFDNPNITYTFGPFGGSTGSVVVDPTNPSNKVCKVIKDLNAAPYAGVIISTVLVPILSIPIIPFLDTRRTLSARVLSPRAGITVLLKVENINNGSINMESSQTVTQANVWQTLTFTY